MLGERAFSLRQLKTEPIIIKGNYLKATYGQTDDLDHEHLVRMYNQLVERTLWKTS